MSRALGSVWRIGFAGTADILHPSGAKDVAEKLIKLGEMPESHPSGVKTPTHSYAVYWHG
jgi:hypothetical protein